MVYLTVSIKLIDRLIVGKPFLEKKVYTVQNWVDP